MLKPARSRHPFRWLTAVFLLLALLDLLVPLLRRVDGPGGDVLLQWHAQTRPASPDVVIIDIDQKSLEVLQDEAGKWPWPRSMHVTLLDGLMAQKPRAVLFDMLFNERDVMNPEGDLAFNDALARYPQVFVATALMDEGKPQVFAGLPKGLGLKATAGANPGPVATLLLPLALRPENWRAGLINFRADPDGIGRSYWVRREIQGWQVPSLPAQVAAALGKPLPDTPAIVLNWQAKTPFRHVSFADLYRDWEREHPLRPRDEFRDKLVIIGTSAPGLMDFSPTPLDKAYPGVEILATALDNLWQGDALRSVSVAWNIPALVLGLGLLLLGFERGVSAWRLGGGLLAASALVLATCWGLLQHGWWWPVLAILAWWWLAYATQLLLAWQQERRRQQQLVSLFSRVMDPHVVQDLAKRGEISREAQSREITVLFSDIRGFTTLSESRSPEAIVNLLNRYFTTQVEIIFRHGGTLDKFIGDAIMAFWGAPVTDPDHARHAVRAAVEMSLALERFKAEVALEGVPFDIGIGLHTGPAVVGFIGADERLDYTTIGDTVNLASRIEGQTKGIARVLISESTRQACGEAFAYVDHGEFHVKGREQPVRLFEPVMHNE